MKKFYFYCSSIFMLVAGSTMAQPTQPPAPQPGSGAICTLLGAGGVSLDQCPAGSTTFQTNFQNGVYNRGNAANSLGIGAIWRFANVGSMIIGGVPTTINTEVEIIGSFQAELTNIDDNFATDHAGVSVADFFAPIIRPDVPLNLTDRRGYVEFKLTFFQGTNDFSTAISMNSLNFVSYDADGNYNTAGTSAQSWFRETRVAEQYGVFPQVLASSTSELSAYNYTDPVTTNWTGFAGGVYDRTGISRCAEVASSFRYGAGANARSDIRFRFGYDFKAGATGYNVGQPGRQYGARFGCFSFPGQSTLPVTLNSFSGAIKNGFVTLNWVTENEENLSGYEIERSTNGNQFTTIGNVNAYNLPGTKNYQSADDLSAETNIVFYYRLKMIDIDGRFKYSQVILINKTALVKGMTISPNPIASSEALTLRFQASTPSIVTIRIVDMAGKQVKFQQARATVGTNSIQVNELQKLQAGIYNVQVLVGDELNALKLSIVR